MLFEQAPLRSRVFTRVLISSHHLTLKSEQHAQGQAKERRPKDSASRASLTIYSNYHSSDFCTPTWDGPFLVIPLFFRISRDQQPLHASAPLQVENVFKFRQTFSDFFLTREAAIKSEHRGKEDRWLLDVYF